MEIFRPHLRNITCSSSSKLFNSKDPLKTENVNLISSESSEETMTMTKKRWSAICVGGSTKRRRLENFIAEVPEKAYLSPSIPTTWEWAKVSVHSTLPLKPKPSSLNPRFLLLCKSTSYPTQKRDREQNRSETNLQNIPDHFRRIRKRKIKRRRRDQAEGLAMVFKGYAYGVSADLRKIIWNIKMTRLSYL